MGLVVEDGKGIKSPHLSIDSVSPSLRSVWGIRARFTVPGEIAGTLDSIYELSSSIPLMPRCINSIACLLGK